VVELEHINSRVLTDKFPIRRPILLQMKKDPTVVGPQHTYAERHYTPPILRKSLSFVPISEQFSAIVATDLLRGNLDLSSVLPTRSGPQFTGDTNQLLAERSISMG